MLSRNPPLPVEVLDPDRLLAFKEPIVAADSESAVYLPPTLPRPCFRKSVQIPAGSGAFPGWFLV